MNYAELKPGVYPNIPAADYHGRIEAVSNSYLKRLDACPAAARVPQEDSPAFAFGRAVHSLVLEGEGVFLTEFCVAPDCDKRTKEGKNLFAEFQMANEGKEVVTAFEAQTIFAMRDAIHKHPFAKTILKEGKSEQTVLWDDASGIRCKCRPDRIPANGQGVIIDLKTTNDAGAYAFGRSVSNYGYAQQAAFYLDGFNAATGSDADAFIFVAVGKTAPFRVETYILDPEFIQYGRDNYKALLYTEIQCREKGDYPNYTDAGLQTLYKPGYL